MDMEAYVSVELANEAGEIVMLKVLGEQIAGEFSGAPYYESGSVFVPGNEVVHSGVVHQLEGLDQEWSRQRSLRLSRSLHRSGIASLFDRQWCHGLFFRIRGPKSSNFVERPQLAVLD